MRSPLPLVNATGSLAPFRLMITAMLLAPTVSLIAAEPGATVFDSHCIPCHGPDGKARTPAGRKLGAKDLSESKLADAEIAKQIRDGVKDSRGVDKMPAFREKVTPVEIEALVAYVKAFRSRK